MKNNEKTRRAWREKFGLCLIAFMLCTALAFLTFFFQRTVCIIDRVHFKAGQSFNSNQVVIHGNLYDVTKSILEIHRLSPYFQRNSRNETTFPYIEYAQPGVDISAFFPLEKSALCATVTPTTCIEPVNFPGISYCHKSPESAPILESSLLGPLYIDYRKVVESRDLVIYNNKVLNISSMLNGAPFFGAEMVSKFRSHVGGDITKAIQSYSQGRIVGECAAALFIVGFLDASSLGCIITDIVLYLSLLIICTLIIAKFIFAVYFSWAISNQLGALEKNRAQTQNTRRQEIDEKHFAFSMNAPGGDMYSTFHRSDNVAPANLNDFSSVPASKYSQEIHTMYYSLILECL
jgi:chitin synthase